MKKIIAFASASALALTLAACGGSEVDEPAEAEIAEAAPAIPAVSSKAGTYTSLTAEGAELVVALNADGTFTVSEAGAQVENGTWEDTDAGTCLTATGETAGECSTIVPGTETGTMNVTDSEGNTVIYTYVG